VPVATLAEAERRRAAIRDSPEPPPKIGKSVSRPDIIPYTDDSEDGEAVARCPFARNSGRCDFSRPRRGCCGWGLVLLSRAWTPSHLGTGPPHRGVWGRAALGHAPGGAKDVEVSRGKRKSPGRIAIAGGRLPYYAPRLLTLVARSSPRDDDDHLGDGFDCDPDSQAPQFTADGRNQGILNRSVRRRFGFHVGWLQHPGSGGWCSAASVDLNLPSACEGLWSLIA
jgi:hypothetical protein